MTGGPPAEVLSISWCSKDRISAISCLRLAVSSATLSTACGALVGDCICAISSLLPPIVLSPASGPSGGRESFWRAPRKERRADLLSVLRGTLQFACFAFCRRFTTDAVTCSKHDPDFQQHKRHMTITRAPCQIPLHGEYHKRQGMQSKRDMRLGSPLQCCTHSTSPPQGT